MYPDPETDLGAQPPEETPESGPGEERAESPAGGRDEGRREGGNLCQLRGGEGGTANFLKGKMRGQRT